VFRRGEQGWSSRDVLTGTVLTQCLQGSAQCCAGASRDGLAGMYYKGCSNRDGFDAVFAGFCAVFRRGEQGWSSRDGLAGMFKQGRF
jgi:hypothetical protein